MIEISGVKIGEGQPCRFVAEISNNHNGDRDRCGRLIDAAKAAGASAVKFQCYTADELVALRGDGPAPDPWGAQGWTMRSLYEHAATPFDWFPKIKAHCERVGIPWFSSVFGLESLTLLESLGCPAYKIAALDAKQEKLLRFAMATHKPVIVSTDTNATEHEAHAYLWCPAGYPQTEFRLTYGLRGDSDWYGCEGFSYHGTDPQVPVVAAAVGAHLIETHFMLRDEPSALEANVSLDEYQFKAMVDAVRRTEVLLGHP